VLLKWGVESYFLLRGNQCLASTRTEATRKTAATMRANNTHHLPCTMTKDPSLISASIRTEYACGAPSVGVPATRSLVNRDSSSTEFYGRFVAYSTGGGRMESSTSSLYLAVPIVVAGLATLWTVWPEKYVAWIQAMKNKMPPSMRAGADGVQAIFPLSSTKPWYPKFLRVVGILLWVFLLWFAYTFYSF
jgi:hypothetical protein